MPLCEPVSQVIESGYNSENLEKLSINSTVFNMHYVIHIIGFHVTLIWGWWNSSPCSFACCSFDCSGGWSRSTSRYNLTHIHSTPHHLHTIITYCHIQVHTHTVVSCLYTPLFATLALVESVGGAISGIWHFILRIRPLFQGYVYMVTLYYRSLQKLVQHRSAFASLVLQKLDGQDRLTEVGHSVDGSVFQALRGFVLSMCYSIDTTRWHACDCWRIP